MKPRPRHKKPSPKIIIIIIAGPNGAGKTTFAKQFLLNEADCQDFINADLIALGLSPFKPESAAIEAGRIMLTMIAIKVASNASFAFETTLSGRAYAKHMKRWRASGYKLTLIFLSLPSADSAVERVKSRVAQGGHDIPEWVIRRRFDAGLNNFRQIYSKLVSEWMFYDNSGDSPRFLASGKNV